MRSLAWKDVHKNEDWLLLAIRTGKIFIYPTDTIYGIGCNALNQAAVEKIRASKSREAQKPFSIIAPSKEWIAEHFYVNFPAFLEKLPGPFTFILEKKDPSFLRAVSSTPTLGVRMPAHGFLELVKKANIPFVTTSVNVSGQPHAKEISSIPQEIVRAVDIVIDAGKLENPPSEIWDLSGKEPKHVPRKN